MRLLPLLIGLYIISYLDRVNVGFAALTMNADIGLSSAVYGWGAGLFFIGYCLFEVPSNILMTKVGARRWIARILLTWGAIATCMALVEGPKSFLTLRFLLGVAEAGFFPAVITYLTLWFPARYRARIISIFMLSIPVSLALGAPISSALLGLDGMFGLKGWQWLFIIQGLPGVFMVGVVLKYLTDSPQAAKWLTDAEKDWLRAELEKDVKHNHRAIGSGTSVFKIFLNPIILALCGIYFCACAANVGLSMFLPQILKQQGFANMEIGFLTAIPYIVGCVGMVTIGFLSDRFQKRKAFVISAMLLIAAGMVGAGYLAGSVYAIAAMSVATIGIMGCKGPFWPLPALYLSGTSAAAGVALINSVGNLGGFFGPGMVGMAKDMTGDFQSGLYLLAALAIVGVILTMLFVSDKGPQAKKDSGGEPAVANG